MLLQQCSTQWSLRVMFFFGFGACLTVLQCFSWGAREITWDLTRTQAARMQSST